MQAPLATKTMVRWCQHLAAGGSCQAERRLPAVRRQSLLGELFWIRNILWRTVMRRWTNETSHGIGDLQEQKFQEMWVETRENMWVRNAALFQMVPAFLPVQAAAGAHFSMIFLASPRLQPIIYPQEQRIKDVWRHFERPNNTQLDVKWANNLYCYLLSVKSIKSIPFIRKSCRVSTSASDRVRVRNVCVQLIEQNNRN